MKFTHSDLVKIAKKWLLRRCGFAFTELATLAMEIPDAIGFRHEASILVECKTSKADFLADRKKMFRENPWLGVGKYRYYLCPKGVIKPEDLPDRWGLLYVSPKGRVYKKVGPDGNVWSSDQEFMFQERNIKNETALMYSALRRLHLQGVMPLIYDSPWKKQSRNGR